MKFTPLDYPICLIQPKRILETSAWNEHVPFAMFLVDLLKPKVFVELGTHTGVSYSAFCQAVKELGLKTLCTAVDTWEGDKHAGIYGKDILQDLKSHHDPLYSDFSRLIQSSFDEASIKFSDNEIDLLHIDGLHTYEAVRHDFLSWLPKLSDRALVLFHDIAEKKDDFGVWKLWDELKLKYPSFELIHGHGLGVLAVGNKYSPGIDLLIKTTDEGQLVREFFKILGARLTTEIQVRKLQLEISEKDRRMEDNINKLD
jgi:O-antigen biosynthesis protein